MKIVRLFLIAAVLIFTCSSGLADNINVYFSPGDSYQAVNSTFNISILADIPQNPGLVAFGFNLVWDSSMMQLGDVNGTGSPWDIMWTSGEPQSITGFLFPTPDSPPSMDGTAVLLANLQFTCLREGTSGLGIAMDPDLFAKGLQGFYDPAGNPINYSVTGGEVTQGIEEAPEPSTLLLIPSGLASLAWWRKRK